MYQRRLHEQKKAEKLEQYNRASQKEEIEAEQYEQMKRERDATRNTSSGPGSTSSGKRS
jgi:hypothetical protein